jgi:DNA-binding Xre family transcriptional regulator
VRVIFRLHEVLGEESQSQLAHRAGVHFATVHRIYHNQTRRVDLDVIGKLAEALGVEPGDLFQREPTKRRKAG